jgi:tyrosyl-tRNA synthetase
LSRAPAEHVASIEQGRTHPMQAKKDLAHELVARFHGDEAAARAARFFEERFQKGKDYEPVPFRVQGDVADVWICKLLKEIGFTASTAEARRLIAQGAVKVDGQPVDVDFRFGRNHRLLAVGRRRVAEVTFDGPSRGR